MDEFLIHWLF